MSRRTNLRQGLCGVGGQEGVRRGDGVPVRGGQGRGEGGEVGTPLLSHRAVATIIVRSFSHNYRSEGRSRNAPTSPAANTIPVRGIPDVPVAPRSQPPWHPAAGHRCSVSSAISTAWHRSRGDRNDDDDDGVAATASNTFTR